MPESSKIRAIWRTFLNPNIFFRTAVREKIIRNVGVQLYPVQNQTFSECRDHRKESFYILKQNFSMLPRIVLGFSLTKRA